ncbi:MAG: 4a-hydroxytetrahydrobiopterin dehydratase [Bacteroidia bacterium]|nr:4a-hydroxytetrahydrobiopterin dehydratase [Bacteroidia bacterium]
MNAYYAKEEVESRLVFLTGWKFRENGIEKDFEFRDFVRCFAFMTCVAMEAERMNHHPDWSNSYNKVKVRLTTHSAGGVTDQDFKLAERIEKYA